MHVLAPKVKALLPDIVIFDFEWTEQGKIFAASFVTETEEKVLLERNFPNEKTFIQTVQNMILSKPDSGGWNTLGLGYSRDSDLDMLTMSALRLGIKPIFDRQTRTIKDKRHIDFMRVFEKKLVRNSMFKNRYRDLKLETVSQCFLKRGKTGHGYEAVNYEEKRLIEYVLEDSRLVFELMSVGMFDKNTDEPTFDGALLDTMAAISNLTEIEFAKVCNGNLSQWWSKIFDKANAPPAKEEFMVKEGEFAYQGGELITPVSGLYKDIDVLDVQSLYPTMIENYNISHETIGCECCKDDITAKIDNEIIPRNYWVCKKQEGILARRIRAMKAERVKQKKAGNTAQAEGLKILLNGAYGLYGSAYFKYSDRRVAELITALARWTTFKNIKNIAEYAGFTVIYGDTDSIFCKKENPEAQIKDVIETVSGEINVTLEHEKAFTDLIISKKKHYMGKQRNKDGSFKVVVKGIEWIKGDRGKWVNQTGKRIEEAFKNGDDILTVVKSALAEMENDQVPAEFLRLGIRLTKNPEDYKGNSAQKKIGLLTHAKAGEVAYYFKGVGGDPTLNPAEIDKKKYRELLLNTCEDVLTIMGCDLKKLQTHYTQTLDSLWE